MSQPETVEPESLDQQRREEEVFLLSRIRKNQIPNISEEEAFARIKAILDQWKQEAGPQLTEEESFARIEAILDQWEKEEGPRPTEEEAFARIKAILGQWRHEDEENGKIAHM